MNKNKVRRTPGCPCCEVAKLLERYEGHLVAANDTVHAIAEVVATNAGPAGSFAGDQLHEAAPHQRRMVESLFAARDALFPFARALGVEATDVVTEPPDTRSN